MPHNLSISNKRDSKENSCISLEQVVYDKGLDGTWKHRKKHLVFTYSELK
jgi:hypothetical protein